MKTEKSIKNDQNFISKHRFENMIDLLIILTFACSLLSLMGSILVLLSYMIVSSAAKPKAAQLIRNLALTDFVWFASSILQSSFWLVNQEVPDALCYILSPLVVFVRMASLVWTCAISFDVYMSVTQRKWLWKSEEARWESCKRRYYAAIALLSLPVAVSTTWRQISVDHGLGCNPEVEQLGAWYIILITQLLPITIGTLFNIFVVCRIFHKMSIKAYPQSGDTTITTYTYVKFCYHFYNM